MYTCDKCEAEVDKVHMVRELKEPPPEGLPHTWKASAALQHWCSDCYRARLTTSILELGIEIVGLQKSLDRLVKLRDEV